jgi:ubiquinone biosynthesis protein
MDIVVHFGLKIPAELYLLIKALATIERVTVTLNPSIDFVEEMHPFVTDLLRKQYDPRMIASEVFDSLREYYKLLTELPSDINEIISRLKEGRFRTQIEVKGFEPLIEHLDLASNRVAIAIVLAALIIGASILTQWEQLRWIGAVVFVLAGLLGFWLLIKLFKRLR